MGNITRAETIKWMKGNGAQGSIRWQETMPYYEETKRFVLDNKLYQKGQGKKAKGKSQAKDGK